MHKTLQTHIVAVLLALLPVTAAAWGPPLVPPPVGVEAPVPPAVTFDVAAQQAEAATAVPHTFVGAFLGGRSSTGDRIKRYRAKTGSTPAVVMFHALWGGGFSRFYADGIKANMQAIVDAGAIPMVTWEPWAGHATDPKYALRRIIPASKCPASTIRCYGRFDAYVKRWARELAEWLRAPESRNSVVMIRLAHEMNGSWTGWSRWRNGNTNAEFKAFWRYVVSTFRSVLKGSGAPGSDVRSRVKWVFAPNEPSRNSTPVSLLFPGDRYVDYLGFSAYNWGKSISWGAWHSLPETFRTSMTMLQRLPSKRPIIAAETGSVEQGGSKAAWIINGFNALRRTNPRLVGIIWYDFHDPRGPNFRIDSSASSLAAWKKVVSGSYFSLRTLP